MIETKIDIWKRKVRNGKRKQVKLVQLQKEIIWNKLKSTPSTSNQKIKVKWPNLVMPEYMRELYRKINSEE